MNWPSNDYVFENKTRDHISRTPYLFCKPILVYIVGRAYLVCVDM